MCSTQYYHYCRFRTLITFAYWYSWALTREGYRSIWQARFSAWATRRSTSRSREPVQMRWTSISPIKSAKLRPRIPAHTLHIISKDTGFDPLIQHLKSKKIFSGRLQNISDIPLLKAVTIRSPSERAALFVTKLTQPKVTKPRTVLKLRRLFPPCSTAGSFRSITERSPTTETIKHYRCG